MSQETTYEMPDSLTISQAQRVYEDLHGLLECNDVDKVIMNAADVRKVDAAGVQLLLSFYRTASKFHKQVVWNKPSDTLVDSAHILGLDGELSLSKTIN